MRRLLVAGNWKMNASNAMVDELLNAILADEPEKADVAVFPPALYIGRVAGILNSSRISVGGQTLYPAASGAYTGEMSADMLSDCGCSAVLVGHSERRTLFGETDEDVVARTQAALASGLTPYICIGETLEERDAGETESVVARQAGSVLSALKTEQLSQCVFAYEPVWAIGTGKTASPEQAQEVHHFLRTLIAEKDASLAEDMRILYGGSVKADNAAQLFAQKDIDGGLVGGASLKASEFLGICNAI